MEGTTYSLPQVTLQKQTQGKTLSRGPYSNLQGWFSAGYGPFRRLTGPGGEDDTATAYGQDREARHHTLFSEGAALTRCEKWLISLYSQSVDPNLPRTDWRRERLTLACQMINALLPSGVQIESVTTLAVTFATRSGARVTLSQLSDGYRSFLALAIDLLRHILDSVDVGTLSRRKDGNPFVDTEGVVLIDEADAHLHPTWQRDIGFRMCEAFPNIQFIVSSHSPFIAQAAREDGLFIARSDEHGRVSVEPAEGSVRGWRADQILLSPLFGLGSTRDPETEGLMVRRTALLGKHGTSTPRERKELQRVEAVLRERLTAPGDTYEERERERRNARVHR